MAGRPLKFETPELLQEKIEEYFTLCEEKGKAKTKGGLALYLDTTRETLGDYEKKEEYSDALKGAYCQIEEDWVQRLSGTAVTGTIFYLKNAYSKDWRDKTEQDVTSGGEKITPIYAGKSILGYDGDEKDIQPQEKD